jgi:hypothetical protein
VAHDPSGDASDRRSAEDAAWQAIVDNYGERPHLDEESSAADPEPEVEPERPSDSGPFPSIAEPTPVAPAVDPEEHYVPPPPPPIPRAEPARLLAWVGLFGVPTFVLVALVTRLPIASWLGLLLMVWFVGGFVFLVASMRSEPRDENDDGAVL